MTTFIGIAIVVAIAAFAVWQAVKLVKAIKNRKKNKDDVSEGVSLESDDKGKE